MTAWRCPECGPTDAEDWGPCNTCGALVLLCAECGAVIEPCRCAERLGWMIASGLLFALGLWL